MVYLLGDPTEKYQAVVYDQNGNPINQFNIAFGNAVIEQVPLGLATLLPYLFYADFTASPGTLNGLDVQDKR